jgi:hypothetical protein
MRRFLVSLAFVLVTFMGLTALGIFGDAFSDSVRHLVRDNL